MKTKRKTSLSLDAKSLQETRVNLARQGRGNGISSLVDELLATWNAGLKPKKKGGVK